MQRLSIRLSLVERMFLKFWINTVKRSLICTQALNSLILNIFIHICYILGMSQQKQSKHYFDFFDFFAGGIAGIVAKTLTAPIERVKLLLQTESQNSKLKTKYKGIADCFTRCVKQEGFLSLWRGNGVNVIRYFPTQAINFSTKDFYGRLLDVSSKQGNKTEFLLYSILCGGLAGSTTTCFVHPLDFARTRLAVDLGKTGS